jgi:hypothetical protein
MPAAAYGRCELAPTTIVSPVFGYGRATTGRPADADQ